MKKMMFLVLLSTVTLVLFSQIKANVKMLNGDAIPCEITTEQLDLVTDYGELSFETKYIKSIQFPEPGKGNTVLNTIFGETFRGFITNDIIQLNVYGSVMQIRKAKINNIEFLNEKQQATEYNIIVSLRNGDAFYATPADSTINIQTSYGEVKLPFENMSAISFEGFGNVLTRIEMKDGGIMQGIIKDDYIPVNLLSEIELEVVPDLMKEIEFVVPKEKVAITESQEDSIKTNTLNNDQLDQIALTSDKKSMVNYMRTTLLLVEKGQFEMGNTNNYPLGQYDEKPIHTVKLTYDFYIGQYEITFDEYDPSCIDQRKTRPDDNGWGRGQRPVINVSWWDAIDYCNWLSEKEGLAIAYDQSGNLLDKNGKQTEDITKVEGYRLPTEAEWEYAARGGHKSTNDYLYAGSDEVDEVGWCNGNTIKPETNPVGRKQPNELGLYDMSGNVKEWCHSKFTDYPSKEQINPIGKSDTYTTFRILRSGSFSSAIFYCRVSDRSNGNPSAKLAFAGFRIARTKGEF